MYPLLQRQVVPERCGMSKTGQLLVSLEQQIKNLTDTLQILVSRYPDCETLITDKEIVERSDAGVLMSTRQVDGGYLLKIRQR